MFYTCTDEMRQHSEQRLYEESRSSEYHPAYSSMPATPISAKKKAIYAGLGVLAAMVVTNIAGHVLSPVESAAPIVVSGTTTNGWQGTQYNPQTGKFILVTNR
jgi:hypothetical protein